MELARLNPFAQYWEVTEVQGQPDLGSNPATFYLCEYFMSLSLSFFINSGMVISPACLLRVSN